MWTQTLTLNWTVKKKKNLRVINVVKLLAAVTVNGLLMTTSPIEISRYEISKTCAHSFYYIDGTFKRNSI